MERGRERREEVGREGERRGKRERKRRKSEGGKRKRPTYLFVTTDRHGVLNYVRVRTDFTSGGGGGDSSGRLRF